LPLSQKTAERRVAAPGTEPIFPEADISDYYDALGRIAKAQFDAQARSAAIYIS